MRPVQELFRDERAPAPLAPREKPPRRARGTGIDVLDRGVAGDSALAFPQIEPTGRLVSVETRGSKHSLPSHRDQGGGWSRNIGALFSITDFIKNKMRTMSDPKTDPRTDRKLPTRIAPTNRLLTAERFQRLSDVPPEVEWFANIRNLSTRRAYENAIRDFMQFTGIARAEEFRTVTPRSRHRLARRSRAARARRRDGPAPSRGAVLALFEYLCEKNAVTHNPVKGVKRPKAESGEGKTPALGDHQARDLLVAPGKDIAADEETIKEKRDRAILSTLLFHALRRGELCKLKVKDFGRHAAACHT